MAIKKLDLLRVITSSNYLYNFSSSYSNKAKTASYALNASGGGGSSLRTGSTYPITASYASRAITASYALNASGGGSSLAGAQTFISNGSQTVYTLNQSVVNRDQILVVTNGVVQSRTGSNYTVSGTTLTLSEAVQNGGLVDVRYINAGQGSSGTSGTNGAGSTLGTGSTYPITSSYARKAITASYLTTISQSLIPAKNNVYSLGSPTKKWKDIYVSTSSIYFDNYSLRVAVKNNSPQLLFNTSSIVTVPSGSNTNTASYATKALTASYALNASGGGGGGGSVQTGSIANQIILYNVTTSQDNVITGLNLSSNKWGVTVIEEWNSGSGDIFYPSCSLLMHFSGSNGSTTFIDNSPSPKTATRAGNVQISTVQSKFGGASGLFDGTGDNLSFSTNSQFAFGTGDFTIEMWIYPQSAVGYQCVMLIGTAAPYIFIGINAGSTGTPFMWNDGNVIVGSQNFTINAWQHWSVVRNSGTVTMYLNGTNIGSASFAGSLTDVTGTYIGTNSAGSQGFVGYIDELRITKGVARYTANFTPPTSPFPNQSPQFETKYVGLVGGLNDSTVDYGVEKLSDSSLKIRKMSATGQPLSGSGQLSASVDRVYVNVLDYTKVSVTSSYATNALTASYILGGGANGSSGTSGATGAAGTSGTSGNGGTSGSSGTSATAGSSGTSGVGSPGTSGTAGSSGTSSTSTLQTGSLSKQTILYNVTSGSTNTITGLSLGGNKWDVSVVEEWDAINGDLFYNSSSLLMHFSGSNGSTTFIDNSPSVKTVTSNNGAAISSLQSKFGNRSGLFDGVDDYLSISGNTVCNFGSSNFTVECWVRLNAMPTSDAWPTNYSSHFVVITAGTPNLGDGIGFMIGQTKLIAQSNDSQIINATHGMTTNIWYHIAYVRSGNTLYLFVNGTQIGSTASFSSAVGTGATTYIGCETGQGAFFNGYMDELRVTKGIARYTSNFTEPSAEFGNVRGQVATKYIGTVGGLNDRSVDYGVQKLSDSSLRIVKMSVPGLPYPALSGSLSGSVSRVYVNVLDYTKVAVTSSYSLLSKTASYALNASGGGSTLRTGSTYPITASYASGGGTMSNGRVYGMTLLFS